MGKRKGMPLTESDAVKLRAMLKDQENKELYYVFEVLIGTGIRSSDGKTLADRYKELKTRILDVMIPKQSKIKPGEKPKLVKRTIKFPDSVGNALQSGEGEMNSYGVSGIKKKVKMMQEIAHKGGISRPISPHDFRHTFIMFAKHRGFDMLEVMSTTKHASPTSFIKYGHDDQDIIEAVYDSMNKDFFDIKQPKKIMRELNVERQKVKILDAQLNAYKERFGTL